MVEHFFGFFPRNEAKMSKHPLMDTYSFDMAVLEFISFFVGHVVRRNGRNMICCCCGAAGQHHRQCHILEQEAPESPQCPHSIFTIRLSRQQHTTHYSRSLLPPSSSESTFSERRTQNATSNGIYWDTVGRGRI